MPVFPEKSRKRVPILSLLEQTLLAASWPSLLSLILKESPTKWKVLDMISSLAHANVLVLTTGSKQKIWSHSKTLVNSFAEKGFLLVALQVQSLKQLKYSSSNKAGKMIKQRELYLFSKTVSEITSQNS